MTVEKIKQNVIEFASKMANDGAQPEDTLTAVSLLIECTLKSLPAHTKLKVARIYLDTVNENLK